MPVTLYSLVAEQAIVSGRSPVIAAGPWRIVVRPDRCDAVRDYTQGGEALELRIIPPLDTLSGTDFEISRPSDASGYDFGTGRIAGQVPPQDFPLQYAIRPAENGTRIFEATIDAKMRDLEHVTQWTLFTKGKATFDMAGVGLTMTSLRRCQERLMHSWGVNPAVQNIISSEIEANDRHYVTSEDYPADAIRRALFGRVVAILDVNADGKVTGCRIGRSAGRTLDAGSCAALFKARLPIWRGPDKSPASYRYAFTVNWVLPPN